MFKSIGAILVALTLVGCEKTADVKSPSNYAADGIKFKFPKKWKVTDDKKTGAVHRFFVESPGNAILFALVISQDGHESLSEFATSYSQKANSSIKLGKLEDPTIATKATPSEEIIAEKFTVTIGETKIPHLREYRMRSSPERVAYLVSQSAEEDLDKTAAGFELIIDTFSIDDSSGASKQP